MKSKTLLLLAFAALTTGCFHIPSTTRTVDWKTYKFDDFHFSVDSPAPFDRDLAGSPKKGILKEMEKQTPMDSYSGGKFFTVTITCFDAQGKIRITAKELSDSVVKAVRDMKLFVSDLDGKTEDITCSGLPAAYFSGTCKIFHFQPARYVMINTVKGEWAWQVNVIYPDKDDESEQMAQKVLKSLKIKVKDLDRPKGKSK